MKDARRHPREVVDHFLRVVHRDSGELVGYLTDVTVEGGMLESEEPLPEGEVYPLRIELVEPIAGNQTIDLDARCVWNRTDPNAVFHYAGFQFTEVSAALMSQIEELAERYRLTQSG